MHFSDIHRAVVVTLALALFPSAVRAQAETDEDEPPPPVVKAPEATPAPSPSPTPEPSAAAAPGAEGAGAAEVTPPPEKGPETPADAAMTWTALGAQQRSGDGLVSVAFGFTGLPQASYHYALSDTVSLGVAGGFDYGRYIPDGAFDAGGAVAASVKIGLPIDQDLRLGLRGDFGFLLPASAGFALTMDLSANLLAPVAPDLYAGAGIDVPLTIRIYDGGSALAWPLLIGGVVEYRILAPLSIFAEAKVGPAFSAPGGVYFAMKLSGGVAYRL